MQDVVIRGGFVVEGAGREGFEAEEVETPPPPDGWQRLPEDTVYAAFIPDVVDPLVLA